MKHIFTIFILLIIFVAPNLPAQINWTKDPGNPVFNPGPSGSWFDDEVYAPCVIKVGDTLKMWFTGAKNTGVDQIGYATSTDGNNWQVYPGNPVLRVGSAGSWDSQLVVHPEVIFDGTTYHMWYGGSSNPNWYDFDLGYASSQDGIHWTKYDDPTTTNPPYDQSDPVLKRGASGEWDDATLAGVSVISDGDTLRMWYGGCDGANWVNERIGYAKSTNGIDWQKYNGNPVFDGAGALGAVLAGAPFVIADTSGYKMWYTGSDGVHNKIGFATSSDGIIWNPWSTPVLEPVAPGRYGTWDNAHVSSCCVLFDDSLYHLWYSGASSATGYRYRIGYATAPVNVFQNNWTKHPAPVLEKGSAGEWDDDNVVAPCVIKVGGTYHMWYDGNYDNPGTMNNGIGHATSSDGLNWSKDILNPVFLPTAGSWDLAGITQVSVLFDDMESLFHMWYAGWSLPDNGFIGHATSVDGGHWLKDTLNNPVLSPGLPGDWDDLAIVSACVIKVGGTYHMWYDVWTDGSSLMRIGHATSADGVSWEKDPNNPVLIPGNAGSWDYTDTRAVNVVFDGSQFHMWYTGGSWFHYDIGYAISNDGTNWTKNNDYSTTSVLYAASDPVMTRGLSGNWDSGSLFSCSVMLNEATDTLKMWYSGSDNDFIDTRIGYATSPFAVVDGIHDSHPDLPQGFALSQNYPNPFNPKTTICYVLPFTSHINLGIYNILGQKVAVLVSEKKPAGTYKVEWDATGFASGVYYYKLTTSPGFSETKKLVLIR